jgi:hypothetical protein
VDRTAGWDWGYDDEEHNITTPDGLHTHVGTHPTVATSNLCAIRACKGKTHDIGAPSGCLLGKSSCRTGDCYCGTIFCASSCWYCVFAPWELYQKDYWIPTSDGGILSTSAATSDAATCGSSTVYPPIVPK